MSGLPRLVIFDASIAVTGALVAAQRQAEALRGVAETILVLPRQAAIPPQSLAPFSAVQFVSYAAPRRDLLSAIRYPPGLLLTAFQLSRILRKHGSKHLQVNDFYLVQGLLTRLFAYRGQIATWVRIDPRRFGAAGRIWLRLAHQYSDRLIAVSRFIRGSLPDEGSAALVYDPAPDLPQAGGLSPPTRILCIANFIPDKGQEEAVRAFAGIANRFPQAELHLVGGDMGLERNRAYRAGLVALARQGDGADRIHFHPFAADTAAVLASGSIALMLSRSESFSQVALEACAAGLPVVATRCGGPEEIIVDGETGFLVPVGDVAAVSEKLAWLLDHPQEARTMGEAARRSVRQRFSVEAFTRAVTVLFDFPAQTACAIDRNRDASRGS
jgi:L-malate glycosyltransferase